MRQSLPALGLYKLRWILALYLALIGPGLALAGPSGRPSADLNLVPWPQSVGLGEGSLNLTSGSRIVAATSDLLPLAGIVSDEMYKLTGTRYSAVLGTAGAGDVALGYNASLTGSQYTLNVTSQASIQGSNYQSVAMGTATMLQSLSTSAGAVTLPRLAVADAPSADYRGLMVDVKFQWHSTDSLKQMVELCRLYKVNYLTIHTGEEQWYRSVLDSTASIPAAERVSRLLYTKAEMQDLVTFAKDRGVTLVPHNESLPNNVIRSVMPQYFTNVPADALLVDRPEYWAAMEDLTDKACALWGNSPYYHIGPTGGEVPGFGGTAAERAFLTKKGLRNSNDYYRWYLVQMNNMITPNGKTVQTWEGITPDSSSPVAIPGNVITMEYANSYYDPRTLLAEGHKVINSSWDPLYVVNNINWSPAEIYRWNMYLFGSDSFSNIFTQASPNDLMLGASLSSWEQPQSLELESLRQRLAAMAERTWNPYAGLSFADFDSRLAYTDGMLTDLVATWGAVPEPATLGLLAAGFIGLAFKRRGK